MFDHYRIKTAQAGLIMVGIANGLTIIFLGMYDTDAFEVRRSSAHRAGVFLSAKNPLRSALSGTPPDKLTSLGAFCSVLLTSGALTSLVAPSVGCLSPPPPPLSRPAPPRKHLTLRVLPPRPMPHAPGWVVGWATMCLG